VSRELIIVTAGGFGREVHDYATDAGFAVRGFLHDLAAYPGSLDGLGIDHLVLGPIDAHEIDPGAEYAIGLGDLAPRLAVADALLARGARLATVIHPSAFVSPSARLGAGVVIAPFAFIGPHAEVGDLTLVNTHASVAHDARTGRCCILAPYAAMNGRAVLGDGAFLGTHAVVTPRRTVGAGASVSAGSVAVRDVPAGQVAIGNPARSLMVPG